MKRISAILIGALASLAAIMCGGCKDEALRAELRQGRFEMDHPQLEVRVLSREMVTASSEYSGPQLRLTGVVRQREPFALSSYLVNFHLAASVETEGEVRFNFETVRMIDGHGAFTASASLSRNAKLTAADYARLKLEVRDLAWWPERKWQAHVQLVQ